MLMIAELLVVVLYAYLTGGMRKNTKLTFACIFVILFAHLANSVWPERALLAEEYQRGYALGMQNGIQCEKKVFGAAFLERHCP